MSPASYLTAPPRVAGASYQRFVLDRTRRFRRRAACGADIRRRSGARRVAVVPPLHVRARCDERGLRRARRRDGVSRAARLRAAGAEPRPTSALQRAALDPRARTRACTHAVVRAARGLPAQVTIECRSVAAATRPPSGVFAIAVPRERIRDLRGK